MVPAKLEEEKRSILRLNVNVEKQSKRNADYLTLNQPRTRRKEVDKSVIRRKHD